MRLPFYSRKVVFANVPLDDFLIGLLGCIISPLWFHSVALHVDPTAGAASSSSGHKLAQNAAVNIQPAEQRTGLFLFVKKFSTSPLNMGTCVKPPPLSLVIFPLLCFPLSPILFYSSAESIHEFAVTHTRIFSSSTTFLQRLLVSSVISSNFSFPPLRCPLCRYW